MVIYNCDDCKNKLEEQEELHMEILAEVFRLIEELKRIPQVNEDEK